jgi:UDP-glucose:(heptosyl)LPS alpha-1,3-glucosyltransferase
VKVVQVVKRFGLCGGMEEYAYRLTNELSTLGVKVQVVCEQKVHEPHDKNVQISELGKSLVKPRWLSHLLFTKKVRNWARLHAQRDTIIHSHERIDCHHLTTIHSTLYNFPSRRKLPSLRNYFNEYIESRELNSSSVQKIVPVSKLIAEQIETKYAGVIHRLTPPISPGVSPINVVKKKLEPESPVIGFMGKEWKRKGLPKVIDIWRELRKEYPLARLCLAGFPIDELIGISEDELKFADSLGHVDRKEDFYEKIDILIHPAKREAYGMVIAEALSIGIPVICSQETGASELLNLEHTLNHQDTIGLWCDVLKGILAQPSDNFPKRAKINSWQHVASKYYSNYKELLDEN